MIRTTTPKLKIYPCIWALPCINLRCQKGRKLFFFFLVRQLLEELLDRSFKFLLRIARLAGRYDIPWSACSPTRNRNNMVHGQFFWGELLPAIMTKPCVDFAQPPLRLTQLARFFALFGKALWIFIDEIPFVRHERACIRFQVVFEERCDTRHTAALGDLRDRTTLQNLFRHTFLTEISVFGPYIFGRPGFPCLIHGHHGALVCVCV